MAKSTFINKLKRKFKMILEMTIIKVSLEAINLELPNLIKVWIYHRFQVVLYLELIELMIDWIFVLRMNMIRIHKSQNQSNPNQIWISAQGPVRLRGVICLTVREARADKDQVTKSILMLHRKFQKEVIWLESPQTLNNKWTWRTYIQLKTFQKVRMMMFHSS